ncbi:MAG: hypothetical protein M0Z46_16065 [Actinomycetota bacterium]|nr:hypothetical protein [Actinomycetota bacterium]
MRVACVFVLAAFVGAFGELGVLGETVDSVCAAGDGVVARAAAPWQPARVAAAAISAAAASALR